MRLARVRPRACLLSLASTCATQLEQQQDEVKLLLIGSSSVEKTSLLLHFSDSRDSINAEKKREPLNCDRTSNQFSEHIQVMPFPHHSQRFNTPWPSNL
jgi:hypothetical protein